ncbi:hypothetical protein ARMGADRAFT_1112662 [Armillaria gallica]|uniref:Uncharacterized protein n=1 Tax=Armillaria gallica TaxID=47427 RepID=A0A2H3D881_ARMGA|nr:hypothetical protein ARMGADRAFT_1112662 [Armillaria gallica]
MIRCLQIISVTLTTDLIPIVALVQPHLPESKNRVQVTPPHSRDWMNSLSFWILLAVITRALITWYLLYGFPVSACTADKLELLMKKITAFAHEMNLSSTSSSLAVALLNVCFAVYIMIRQSEFESAIGKASMGFQVVGGKFENMVCAAGVALLGWGLDNVVTGIDLSRNGFPELLIRVSPTTFESSFVTNRHVETDREHRALYAPVDKGFSAWSFLVAAFFVERLVQGFPNAFGVFLDGTNPFI